MHDGYQATLYKSFVKHMGIYEAISSLNVVFTDFNFGNFKLFHVMSSHVTNTHWNKPQTMPK